VSRASSCVLAVTSAAPDQSPCPMMHTLCPWSAARDLPAARGQASSLTGVFLPWVLPGILVSWVFAGQGRWCRAPGGRRWSSLATVERPRTAQGRPTERPGGPYGGLRADGQLPCLLTGSGPEILQARPRLVVSLIPLIDTRLSCSEECLPALQQCRRTHGPKHS
jgi:hypothetical protein